MAQSKLLRVLGDLAPISYRAAYLAVADPRELIDLHESGLASGTGCRRLVVAETRSRKNGLDIEAVGSIRQVLRLAEPTGLLILDDPTLATLQSPTILTGVPGSLESRLPPTFTVLRSRVFEIAVNYQPPLVWEKIERHHVKLIRHGNPRWSDPKVLHGQSLRRWTSHKPTLSHLLTLDPEHPAIRDRRTLFRKRITTVKEAPRLLISGSNSRKIGGMVTKGKWTGMPILTLTLEERRTCWSGCRHFADCYGNKMNWSRRIEHGPALETRLEKELRRLNRKYPEGFVVRLHALGDFYSAKYVCAWVRWLGMFPALRAFGYSSWPVDSGIGRAITDAVAANWDRFAIRFSNQEVTERGATTIYRKPESARIAEGIVCPAQTDRTECCGTCALCWQTQTNIVFVAH